MEIILKKKEEILFSELREGNVFEYGGNIYMKTEEVTNKHTTLCNAVCLEHGEMLRIAEGTKVYVINGAFIEK